MHDVGVEILSVGHKVCLLLLRLEALICQFKSNEQDFESHIHRERGQSVDCHESHQRFAPRVVRDMVAYHLGAEVGKTRHGQLGLHVAGMASLRYTLPYPHDQKRCNPESYVAETSHVVHVSCLVDTAYPGHIDVKWTLSFFPSNCGLILAGVDRFDEGSVAALHHV